MKYEKVYRGTAKESAGVIKITHSELEEFNKPRKYRFNLFANLYAVENVQKFLIDCNIADCEVVYSDSYENAVLIAKNEAEENQKHIQK